jgi:hypothetical protein
MRSSLQPKLISPLKALDYSFMDVDIPAWGREPGVLEEWKASAASTNPNPVM